jgi:hypothetical protein
MHNTYGSVLKSTDDVSAAKWRPSHPRPVSAFGGEGTRSDPDWPPRLWVLSSFPGKRLGAFTYRTSRPDGRLRQHQG